MQAALLRELASGLSRAVRKAPPTVSQDKIVWVRDNFPGGCRPHGAAQIRRGLTLGDIINLGAPRFSLYRRWS
ncbi:MAG: hypothetical protein WAM44_18070, partial [Chthoniobacterales bacterium]